MKPWERQGGGSIQKRAMFLDAGGQGKRREAETSDRQDPVLHSKSETNCLGLRTGVVSDSTSEIHTLPDIGYIIFIVSSNPVQGPFKIPEGNQSRAPYKEENAPPYGRDVQIQNPSHQDKNKGSPDNLTI